MIEIEKEKSHKDLKVLVVGIGGAGNNAVNRLYECKAKGVDLLEINTDNLDVSLSKAPVLQIGEMTTKGLGAGGNPDIGEESARESSKDIRDKLTGYRMVIITCGLGGGTGTGASPVVAEIAKELGILTVAVVTTPFTFEGRPRGNIAQRGLKALRDAVDSIIIVANDRLLGIIDRKSSIQDALNVGDEILRQSIQSITDLLFKTAEINIDFADMSVALKNKGTAHIGIGHGQGETKALDAVKDAVENPLLETPINNASDVIISITGDVTLMETNEVACFITDQTGMEVNVFLGFDQDPSMVNECKVIILATGIER